MTDNMAKIQVALESGTVVRNEKGEKVALPKPCDKRTEECLKCYLVNNSSYSYWSHAEAIEKIFVNGQLFEEWFDLQPLVW